ncbi:IgGFc-binding protein-like [Patiria miniata]|uniref:IgGFc-binding protein N-terminal domain-containing protein n=1 Tax=Patiria miniata TaxID=46514 RepID=A0A913ZVS3_PATMI|nr:IgGFc-binding protein-like [Patiria miniata]
MPLKYVSDLNSEFRTRRHTHWDTQTTMIPIIVQLVTLLMTGGNLVGNCMVEAQTNAGQKFVFAFAENYRPNADPTVLITNMSPLDHAIVSVTIKTPVHGLLQIVTLQGFGHTEQVPLPRDIVPVSPELDMVAVIIEANDTVSVYAINDAHDRSMDGFTVLPVSSLGTEYYVASYTPSLRSQIVIVAIDDETEVEIELSNTVMYKDRNVKGGDTILVDAQQHDAFLLSGRMDLTGTRIYARSNHPIAVLSGNRCAFLPIGVNSCDHLVEMLPPFSQWGRQFVVMPFIGRSTGIIYRVIGGRDGTEITVNSQRMRVNQEHYLEFELAVGQSDFVESHNHPVQVVQYTKGYDADGVSGDPAMSIVPPMEQSLNTVRFPTYNTTKDMQTVHNYVNIYAPCAEMYYGNLTMDGVVIRELVSAEQRIVRVDSSAYCGVGLYLTHGVHTIAPAAQGGESFIALAYGFADMNSFAWPVGLGTKEITCLYPGLDGTQLEYSCSRTLVVQRVPCNMSEVVDGEECKNVDCVPNEYVIYIAAGSAVVALILVKLLSHFVIQRTKPPKQLAFGQIGLKDQPPEIAIHDGSTRDDFLHGDSNRDLSETSKTLRPPSPPPQRRSSIRSERAERMRRSSRTPSPSQGSR